MKEVILFMKANLNFAHVGISVRDFDVTRRFYEKLGFNVCTEPYETTWDDYWKEKNAFYKLPENTCGRIFFMRSPNGMEIEFFEFSTMKNAGFAEWNSLGIHHIALKTDDINAVVDLLKKNGIAAELGPVAGTYHFFLFIRDPDGNLIEIAQSFKK